MTVARPPAGRVTEAVRSRWSAVIDALLASGEHDAARECAELAVRHGVWRDAWQRPTHYLPSLPPVPVHSTEGLWFVSHLEQNLPLIRRELDSVTRPVDDGFDPVEERLAEGGDWRQVILYEAGVRQRAADRFPVITEIVEAIPEAAAGGPGVITLSWLAPGTHIVPHCGSSNAKLRLHLPLVVPPGTAMRVGPQTVHWVEGRCLLFDDSFEHEVWHDGREPRLVLLMDVWHPDVDESVRRAMIERRQRADERVVAYMTEQEIDRVELDGDRVMVYPGARTAALMRRYLRQVGATAIALRDGRPHWEGTDE